MQNWPAILVLSLSPSTRYLPCIIQYTLYTGASLSCARQVGDVPGPRQDIFLSFCTIVRVRTSLHERFLRSFLHILHIRPSLRDFEMSIKCGARREGYRAKERTFSTLLCRSRCAGARRIAAARRQGAARRIRALCVPRNAIACAETVAVVPSGDLT